MRTFFPGPVGGSSPGAEMAKNKMVRQHSARVGSYWGRSVYNSNKNLTFTIFSKPNGSYNQGGVFAAAQNAGVQRIAIKLFTKDGSQIDGMIYSTTGIPGLPAALAATGGLEPHFYLRLGNTEDLGAGSLDGGATFADATELTQV